MEHCSITTLRRVNLLVQATYESNGWHLVVLRASCDCLHDVVDLGEQGVGNLAAARPLRDGASQHLAGLVPEGMREKERARVHHQTKRLGDVGEEIQLAGTTMSTEATYNSLVACGAILLSPLGTMVCIMSWY